MAIQRTMLSGGSLPVNRAGHFTTRMRIAIPMLRSCAASLFRNMPIWQPMHMSSSTSWMMNDPFE